MRTHARSETGYTLAELLLVVAMVAVMAFIAVPFMLSYMPSATVNYAACELQSGMNRAKLTAVTTRQLICIKANGGGYEFWTGVSAACAGGAVLPQTGTNTAGTFTLGNSVSVALVTTNPVFTQFGTAVQAGQLRVTGVGGIQQTVTVQASGRVTIP